MKFEKKIFTTILILLYTSFAFADSDYDEEEDLFSADTETSQITEQQYFLQNLRKSKLNINSANFSDLIKFPWLTRIQVNKILKYRKNHEIQNFNSLKKAGLSKEVVEDLSPYIDFHKNYPVFFESRIRSEYCSSTEFNNPLKFYQKYQIIWKNYEFNFLTKKDAGERNFLDYWGSSVQIKNAGFLEKMILGNYRLAVGQGIFFAPKLGISKSANTTGQPVKHYSYFRPYTSSCESFSLFGCAGRMQYKKFYLIPFYSNYKLDATMENGRINNIYVSGYHRTDTELEKKDKVKEKLYGFHLSYGTESTFGLTAFKSEFSHPFADPNLCKESSKFGFDYNAYVKNFNFFGEFGFENRRKAFITGIFWEQADLRNLIIYRNYDSHFQSFHGNPFHASGDFDNERGIYYGISFHPFSNAKLDIYFDLYRFPEPEGLKTIPSYGTDKLLQLKKEWKNCYLKFRLKQTLSEQRRIVNDISKLYGIKKQLFGWITAKK